jgi:hypothetical protein
MKKKTIFLPLWTGSTDTKSAKQTRADAIIELFKKSQRLPLVSRFMKSRDWPPQSPPNGLDLGSFYRL